MSNSTDHCSECSCNIQESCNIGIHPLLGDGFCNDELNIPGCYDHGDCCLSNLNTDHCSNCSCSSNGFITSPGFPQKYENNLDLTWLIQVPLDQFVQIDFIFLHVEYEFGCG